MPFVRGFLRVVSRGGEGIWPSPGEPTHPIAPGGGDEEVWPDPGHPAHPIEIPDPPPGIWPPPTPAHPIVPIPPTVSPQPPPGEIWPPVDGASPGKFVVLAYIPGYGVKYVVIDPSLKPTPSK